MSRTEAAADPLDILVGDVGEIVVLAGVDEVVHGG